MRGEHRGRRAVPGQKHRKHAGFLLRELRAFCTALVKDWQLAIREWEYLVHQTKRRVLMKYVLAMLVIITYLIYVVGRFGGKDGVAVVALTWSFFVFCTPIADAGILIDFPMRLLTHIRMIYSEIIVWTLALIINILGLLFVPGLYEKTLFLQLLHHILTQPWPYWTIIVLSGIGTFLSVIFADELVDVAEEKHRHIHHAHSHKWELIAIITIIVLVLFFYDFLLTRLGLHIPLF